MVGGGCASVVVAPLGLPIPRASPRGAGAEPRRKDNCPSSNDFGPPAECRPDSQKDDRGHGRLLGRHDDATRGCPATCGAGKLPGRAVSRGEYCAAGGHGARAPPRSVTAVGLTGSISRRSDRPRNGGTLRRRRRAADAGGPHRCITSVPSRGPEPRPGTRRRGGLFAGRFCRWVILGDEARRRAAPRRAVPSLAHGVVVGGDGGGDGRRGHYFSG